MRVSRFVVPAAAAALLLSAAAPATHAQDGFTFGQPDASLTFRVGPMMHRADGPLFDFMLSELTLERSDFRAPQLGAEFAVRVHPRVDVAVGAAWAQTEASSEFIHYGEYIDEDRPDEPIEQVTRLSTVPLSLGVKLYPLERGRSVSSLAWLPARTTPYVGAGADVVLYRLQQVGDFVDVNDLTISTQDYQSRGTARTLHARVGIEHWLTSTVGLNLEGRYMHGSGDLKGDFTAYERLDLSGMQAGLGLTVRW